jgi:hypothetical protein
MDVGAVKAPTIQRITTVGLDIAKSVKPTELTRQVR